MRLLRIHDVISVTGISRMTIYRLEKAGLFPTRRRLGKNPVAWLDDDVIAWVVARPTAAQEPSTPVIRTRHGVGLGSSRSAVPSFAVARSSRIGEVSRSPRRRSAPR